MAGLIVQPEEPKRFWGFVIRTVIEVDVGEDGYVIMSVELAQGERLNGPPDPRDGDGKADSAAILLTGDNLERVFLPDEARALAAALMHQADVIERRRI